MMTSPPVRSPNPNPSACHPNCSPFLPYSDNALCTPQYRLLRPPCLTGVRRRQELRRAPAIVSFDTESKITSHARWPTRSTPGAAAWNIGGLIKSIATKMEFRIQLLQHLHPEETLRNHSSINPKQNPRKSQREMDSLTIRFAISVISIFVIAARTYKRKSIDLSGVFAGIPVMVIHMVANYRFA